MSGGSGGDGGGVVAEGKEKAEKEELEQERREAERELSWALRGSGGVGLGRLLGKGTYGKVWEGSGPGLGRVAVKVMRPEQLRPAYVEKFLPRELELAELVGGAGRCPALIGVDQVVWAAQRTMVAVLGEVADGGDLLAYVRRKQRVPEKAGSFLFRQLVEGLRFLHARHLAHRDLKLENILLTWDGNGRVADLGFARIQRPAEPDSETFCGSPAYAAPELLRSQPYRAAGVDLWGLGVILYTMLTGFMPFDDRDIPKMLQRQLAHKVRFSRSGPALSSAAREAVLRLLDPEPWRRPTAEELATQAFLRSVPFHPRLPDDLLLPGFPLQAPDAAASVQPSSAHSARPPTVTKDLPIP